MALSITKVKTAAIGGGMKVTVGTWSATEGDASTTTTAPGYVYLAHFTSTDDGGNFEVVPVTLSRSSTTGVTTITVLNNTGVTAGRYIVISQMS